MLSLKNPYISVLYDEKGSYGGNQMRSGNKTEREVGCGVIAGLDLLLYLCRYHLRSADCGLKLPVPLSGPIAQENYLLLQGAMRKKYLPLIPGHGINGVTLALGMNICFIKNKIPFRALWGVPFSVLWERVDEMLSRDIPVIFSVGPNFPLLWQHNRLKFYVRTDGGMLPGPQTHAHYVTVTGADSDWLQISSWGKRYYIRKDDYLSYVKRHSARLFSNILYIREKKHGED